MEILVTAYLAKTRLPWQLLNNQKKCVSLSEFSKNSRDIQKAGTFVLKDVCT